MSLENIFIDEFSCDVGDELENQDIQAFPETIISDSHSLDFSDFFFPHDSLSLGQLGCGAQFFECSQDQAVKHQVGFVSSQTPSTDEDFASSSGLTNFEEACISYTPSMEKQHSSIRATLQKIISEDEPLESQSSSSNEFIVLDRDPSEVNKRLSDISFFEQNLTCNHPLILVQPQTHFQEKMLEARFSDIQVSSPQEPLEMPAPRQPPQTSLLKVSETHLQTRKPQSKTRSKKPNNRQSQFKNVYSLVEEHSRRLLRDWIELKPGELLRIEEELRKNDLARMEEEKKLEHDVEQLEEIIKNLNAFKKRGKKVCEKKCSKATCENPELAKRKHKQKELLKKLKYKRFRLISSLSTLINDTTHAFLKRTELDVCLKRSPKTRTLACMKAFLKENLKFGLIVSRIAVELLPVYMEHQEPNLLSESTLAFMYWRVKSPMQEKRRELFKRDDSRAHIRGVLKDVYLEVMEAAKHKLPKQDMLIFEEFLNGFGQLDGVSYDNISEDRETTDELKYFTNENDKRVNESAVWNERLQKRTKKD